MNIDLFWPTDDCRINISVYGYVFSQDGKDQVKAILANESPDLRDLGLVELLIRSSWTIPNATQMDIYRQDASEFNPKSRDVMINTPLLREIILTHHLKELIIPPSEIPICFQFTENNQLSLRTLAIIKRLHSGLYDTLCGKYLSEACLMA